MKICSICKNNLPLAAYDIQSTGKQGRRSDCKDCRKRFNRTERGLVKNILANQIAKSKKRKHPAPAYTEEQLYSWFWQQPGAQALYNAWVASGFLTDLKPSIDRQDDYLPYQFGNIELTTVKENIDRYYQDAIQGINTKSAVSVDQYSMDGVFIAHHHSYKAAARAVGQTQVGNIRNVAIGKGQSAYGFRWRNP
jgi:hypothetical protein